MAPAEVPEMPSKRSQFSSSKRSSTPQVKAPCAPPPCKARATRGRRTVLPEHDSAIPPKVGNSGAQGNRGDCCKKGYGASDILPVNSLPGTGRGFLGAGEAAPLLP